MPLNLKITWASGASSKRLMGLDDGTTLAELNAIIAMESGIESGRSGCFHAPDVTLIT